MADERVAIVIDGSGARAGERQVVRSFQSIQAASAGARGAVDQTNDSFARNAERMATWQRQSEQVGRAMSIGVTLPILGVGAAALKMASDAEEAASKFNVVFGSAADTMQQWLTQLQTSVPESTKQLQAMSAEIQDLLVPLGLAPDAALEMTQSVVKLAADLASFNNIPMAEALERIRSGLVGQNEPLLKFGVALSAATVEARALELGLIAEGEQLSAAARAQAAFSLILEGTTAAHGDAANTAESAANQFKFFKRESVELAVVIGNQLLPMIVPLIARATDLLRWITELDPAFTQAGLVMAGVAAAAGPLLLAFSTLITLAGTLGVGVGAMLAIVTGVGAVFAAAVVAGVLIAKNWDEITAAAAAVADGVRKAFDLVGSIIDGTFKFVMGLLRIAFNEIDSLFGGRLSQVVDWWVTGVTQVWDTAERNFELVREAVSTMMDIVWEQLVGRLTKVAEWVQQKLAAITGFFKEMYMKVAGESYVPDMMQVVDHEMVDHLGRVTANADKRLQAATASFETMSTTSSGSIETLLADADRLLGTNLGSVVGKVQGHADTVKSVFDLLNMDGAAAFEKFVSTFKTFFVDKLGGIVENVVSTLTRIIEFIGKIGSFVDKLTSAISSGPVYAPGFGGGGGGGGYPGPTGPTFPIGGGGVAAIDLRGVETLLNSIAQLELITSAAVSATQKVVADAWPSALTMLDRIATSTAAWSAATGRTTGLAYAGSVPVHVPQATPQQLQGPRTIVEPYAAPGRRSIENNVEVNLYGPVTARDPDGVGLQIGDAALRHINEGLGRLADEQDSAAGIVG